MPEPAKYNDLNHNTTQCHKHSFFFLTQLRGWGSTWTSEPLNQHQLQTLKHNSNIANTENKINDD